MAGELKVIYAARTMQEAHLLKDHLEENGIRAMVTNSSLEGGSGVDILGWPTLARVAVNEEDAAAARQIALQFDRHFADRTKVGGDESDDWEKSAAEQADKRAMPRRLGPKAALGRDARSATLCESPSVRPAALRARASRSRSARSGPRRPIRARPPRALHAVRRAVHARVRRPVRMVRTRVPGRIRPARGRLLRSLAGAARRGRDCPGSRHRLLVYFSYLVR